MTHLIDAEHQKNKWVNNNLDLSSFDPVILITANLVGHKEINNKWQFFFNEYILVLFCFLLFFYKRKYMSKVVLK
jgi:hypothetical protein